MTALHQASMNGETQTVKLLIQHGVDVDATDNVRAANQLRTKGQI